MTTTSAHLLALQPRPARPLPYRPWTRLADIVTGRADATTGLVHESALHTQPSASLRRLEHTLAERCELERVRVIRTAAPLIDRRRQLEKAIEAARAAIPELEERVQTLRETSDPRLSRVGSTEAHLTAAQVTGRRHREAAARLAPHEAALSSLRKRVEALVDEAVAIDGKLITLWEGVQARTAALARHYERRASTQARAYLRRVATPEDAASHPLNTREPIHRPAWADGTNPWIPSPNGAMEPHSAGGRGGSSR